MSSMLMKLIFLICTVQAHWDYMIGTGGRTFPAGGGLFGTVGYNQILWGEAGEGKFMYGLVRPKVRFGESVFVHSYDASLSVYPISIFRLSVGQNQSIRYSPTLPLMDCQELTCGGAVVRNYSEVGLVGGYGNVFLMIDLRSEVLTPTDKDRKFADENSTLHGKKGGDNLSALELFAGYRVFKELTAGYLYHEEKMIDTEQTAILNAVVGQYKMGPWQIGGGIGYYRSSRSSGNPSLMLGLKWVGLESDAIF